MGRKGKMAEWQDDWIVFKTFLYVSNNKMMDFWQVMNEWINQSICDMRNSTDAITSKNQNHTWREEGDFEV